MNNKIIRKRKALITGATSFVGRHLIRELLKYDWEIIAIVREESDYERLLPKSSDVHIVALNMENYHYLSSKVIGPCDVFVSLAWNGTRGASRNDFYRQKLNYEYSLISVEQALKLGCKLIISAGSQAEYGLSSGIVSEQSPCRPNTEYGIWKLRFYNAGMEICKKAGVSFKEPRFFSLYGEDDYPGTVILSALDDMMVNRACKLTQCVQTWNFLYIDDACKGVRNLMELRCADGAYNFGSEDTRKLKDFILEMYDLVHSKSELLFGAVPYPPTGMVNVWPDISKLKEETGWHPELTFGEGIQKILQYRRNRK